MIRPEPKAFAELLAWVFQKPSEEHDDAHEPPSATDTVVPPTLTEIENALNKLKNKKAADTRGLIAEMLKAGSAVILPHVLRMFLEILSANKIPPEWITLFLA